MVWVELVLFLGLFAGCLALVILWRRRSSRVRIASRGFTEADGPSGVYGLDTADLAALRQAAQPRRAGWSRDYATEANNGMPGRVGGIPRSLRVKT